MSSIDAANCDATANMFGVEPPILPQDYRSPAAASAGVAAEKFEENCMDRPMPPVLNIGAYLISKQFAFFKLNSFSHF